MSNPNSRVRLKDATNRKRLVGGVIGTIHIGGQTDALSRFVCQITIGFGVKWTRVANVGFGWDVEMRMAMDYFSFKGDSNGHIESVFCSSMETIQSLTVAILATLRNVSDRITLRRERLMTTLAIGLSGIGSYEANKCRRQN